MSIRQYRVCEGRWHALRIIKHIFCTTAHLTLNNTSPNHKSFSYEGAARKAHGRPQGPGPQGPRGVHKGLAQEAQMGPAQKGPQRPGPQGRNAHKGPAHKRAH